jgi:hypothetical protein
MMTYVIGIPPFQRISSVVFEDRETAKEYASQENAIGPYRKRGVKVYKSDSSGNILFPVQKKKE